MDRFAVGYEVFAGESGWWGSRRGGTSAGVPPRLVANPSDAVLELQPNKIDSDKEECSQIILFILYRITPLSIASDDAEKREWSATAVATAVAR